MSRSYLFAFALLVGLVPAASAEEKLITKVYSVADLVVPIEGLPGVKASAPACCEMLGVASGCMKAKKTQEEALISLITNTVKPSSWGDHGGPGTIEYFPLSMGLVVRQSAAGHQEVGDLLTSLRKLQDTQITFEIQLLSIPEDFFERTGVDFEGGSDKQVLINPKQLQTFVSAVKGDPRTNLMHAPKLVTLNGQNATIQCGDTQQFVVGITPIERDGQTMFIPKNEAVFIGTKFEVQGVVAADRKSIVVRLKGDCSSLVGKPELYPVTSMITPIFEGGSQGQPIPFTQYIQKPKIERLSVARTSSINIGSTMVVPMGKMTTETRVINKVPVLGEIPYVEKLFTNVGYGKETNCMVLLVKPMIIEANENCVTTAADGCGIPQAACRNMAILGAMCDELTKTCEAPLPTTKCPLPPQYYPADPAFPPPSDFGYPVMPAYPVVTASATVPAPKPAYRSDTMNLADIVALSTSGVSDDVIINQMGTTGSKFSLCTEDLLFLKKNKVSDRVVMEMQHTRPRKSPEMSAPTAYPMPQATYYPVPAMPQSSPYTQPITPTPVPPACLPAPLPPSAPAYPQPAYPPAPPYQPSTNAVPPMPAYPSPVVTPNPYVPYPTSRYVPAPVVPQALPPVMRTPQVCPASFNSPFPVPVSPPQNYAAVDTIEFFAEAIGALADGILELFVDEGNQSFKALEYPPMIPLVQPMECTREIREVKSQPWSTNQPASWPCERLGSAIGR